MRKLFAWIFLLSVALPSSSFAEAPPSTTTLASGPRVENITFRSRIPSTVFRRMPAGAKSCFFGLFHPLPGKTMAVHFYNANPTRELGNISVGDGLTLHFKAELFDVTANRRRKAAIYRFLTSFPVTYTTRGWPPEKFALQFAWLDPQKKTTPLFLFNCFYIGECQGAAGRKVYSVLPGGWKSQPATQAFSYDDGAGCGSVIFES